MLIGNYFTVAWRNLIRHKLFSLINIVGLAIGLAACMMIALFVRDELSFDQHWANSENIYRAGITFYPPGRDPIAMAAMPGPVIHALKKDFPEVEFAARLARVRPTITLGERSFMDVVSLADSDIINIFDLNVVRGDLALSLAENSNIAIDETSAKKYFGDEDPIGQVMNLNFDAFTRDYKVTAVYRDLPINTQLSLPMIVKIDEKDWADRQNMFAAWFSVNSQLYFALEDGTRLSVITDKLDDFTDRNFPALPMGGPDARVSDMLKLHAIKMTDAHLKAIGLGDPMPQGSMETVYTFSAIAVLVLVIASINFMNLSTARASLRAREVSLRKVVGASKGQLIAQFLGESILLAALGLVISLALLELGLPIYNEFVGKALDINYSSSDLVLLVGMALIVGVVSGLYPAFVLSDFRPATVLKANKSAETSASVKLRAALVIFQFAVSIGLFVSTGVVYGQMLYAKNKDIGFNKENIMVVHRVNLDEAHDQREMLLAEFARNPQVSEVAWSNETPGMTFENNTTLRTPDMAVEDSILIGQRGVGLNFFKTFQIPLLSGRAYDRERASDIRVTTEALREGKAHVSGLVINESALGRLGLGSPEEAIGKIVMMGRGNPEENLEAQLEIIGVVPDVHFDSLRRTIRPEIYTFSNDFVRSISLRFTGDPETLVTSIRQFWEKQVPGIPFESSFVAENVDSQYQAEERQAQMIGAFSMLAVFIACLGLFGLASFSAERRTREIGVRKVMGASVWDVVRLLVWQFSLPVVIANLIAWPVAWYIMEGWLESFVYRIGTLEIVALCLIGGISAMLIAWATVAGNSFRVARSNPIQALRYE